MIPKKMVDVRVLIQVEMDLEVPDIERIVKDAMLLYCEFDEAVVVVKDVKPIVQGN